MKHFLIFLFLISMAYAGEEKKEALELKRQEKIQDKELKKLSTAYRTKKPPLKNALSESDQPSKKNIIAA